MSGFAQWAQSVFNYWRSEYASKGVFDHSDIEDYQKQGYWVVYESEEICCPETDATLGYGTSILKQEDGSLALFLNQEQAKQLADEHQAFCAKPTGTHRPTPKPKLRPKDQPRATDAVLGGRGNQPHSTDAVLGNSITTRRQQLFNKLKSKGGSPQEWSKLAILDSELGYSTPQSQVKPYLNAWNKSIK